MSIEADEAMIVIEAMELSSGATEALIRQLSANLADSDAREDGSSASWLQQLDGSTSIQADEEPILVTFYRGELDGRPVVQIDGSAAFRVNVNDSTIWDQSPEASDWVTIFSAAHSWLEKCTPMSYPAQTPASAAGVRRLLWSWRRVWGSWGECLVRHGRCDTPPQINYVLCTRLLCILLLVRQTSPTHLENFTELGTTYG